MAYEQTRTQWEVWRKFMKLMDYPIWIRWSKKRDVRFGKALFEYAWSMDSYGCAPWDKISLALCLALSRKHDVDPKWIVGYLCEVLKQDIPVRKIDKK